MDGELTNSNKNRLYIILETFPFAASMSSATSTSANVSLETSSRMDTIM